MPAPRGSVGVRRNRYALRLTGDVEGRNRFALRLMGDVGRHRCACRLAGDLDAERFALRRGEWMTEWLGFLLCFVKWEVFDG